MAGVAQNLENPVGAGMFSTLARAQYGALGRMRWEMFRNGLRSRKGAMELGANMAMILLYTFMGVGMAVGLGIGAGTMVSSGEWKFLPILFWAVAVMWQVVPISMASFQQQFDPGGLLRFPMSFGTFYVLHLVFGLVDASTIVGAFCCTGMLVGISVARPDLTGWAALALLVFAAFNILLVRAIFAWIERWLAQRRTREIMTALFFLVILSFQLFNPALHQKAHHGAMTAEQRQDTMLWLHRANRVQRWLPPGLVAGMLQQAQAGQPAEGLEAMGLAGLFVLGIGGVLAARLRAEFRGENFGEAPARKETRQRRRGEWLIDGSGPVAAVMEKELRTLLRAIPLLYQLGAPLLMVFVFTAIARNNTKAPNFHFPIGLLLYLAYGIVAFTQLIYNNLGTEGAGIQILFMSPTPIRTVMLAKNLFHCGLFAVEAAIICAISAWRLGMPAPDAFLATLSWVLFAIPVHLAAGDIFSITMPYRVNLGRLRRQPGSQGNALFSLLIQVGVLGVGAAVLGLCALFGELWFAIPIFLILAGGAVFAWLRVLSNVDRLANKRREDLVDTLVRTE